MSALSEVKDRADINNKQRAVDNSTLPLEPGNPFPEPHCKNLISTNKYFGNSCCVHKKCFF
jgi:hypothetical protein